MLPLDSNCMLQAPCVSTPVWATKSGVSCRMAFMCVAVQKAFVANSSRKAQIYEQINMYCVPRGGPKIFGIPQSRDLCLVMHVQPVTSPSCYNHTLQKTV